MESTDSHLGPGGSILINGDITITPYKRPKITRELGVSYNPYKWG